MAGDAVGFAPTWEAMAALARALAEAARADGVPDVVVGVARGGLVPAVMVAHQLGVRDLRSVMVTHTLSDAIAASKADEPAVGDPDALGALAGCDVLVVDDVAGTGQALAVAAGLARRRAARRVRTAVGVVNDANWAPANDAAPEAVIDYIGARCSGWVAFPWEAQ